MCLYSSICVTVHQTPDTPLSLFDEGHCNTDTATQTLQHRHCNTDTAIRESTLSHKTPDIMWACSLKDVAKSLPKICDLKKVYDIKGVAFGKSLLATPKVCTHVSFYERRCLFMKRNVYTYLCSCVAHYTKSLLVPSFQTLQQRHCSTDTAIHCNIRAHSHDNTATQTLQHRHCEKCACYAQSLEQIVGGKSTRNANSLLATLWQLPRKS